ncbi:MAG: carboxypeptidase regulatory-like domain-containing protein [Candidatus Cloacimonetes bacterium]|nr:carboxypeptidase regulatory-like domain-containing protein [Candidatus Cloacimonadota bacterium]MCF7815245.1 carboxypeptidase regulatory-like domain-containing protein [Candidatus Cloacimonadota bacterium]MCF7869403.1 carboxypeptidase regulatory-like domain-containing protein [Candidatus Cloacimonadota bacterium]MCF7884796.1 carboxypeptidase regulatory-like domain-containing protein [Candidatus Cloacimonadota bacterium]
MKKRVVLLLLSLIVFSCLLVGEQSEHYFRFYLHHHSQLSKITRLISIDDVKDGYVYAYANDKQLQKFKILGYSLEMLQKPGTLYKPDMTDDIETNRIWTEYPTYDAFVTIMYQFAIDYPSLCTVENIGTTVQGREILMAKISDNVQSNEAEPEFLYVATMHGDETAGYICLLNLIEHLLENYGTVPRITNIVDNLVIWISPLQNPDGTYFGGNNSVAGAQRFNANFVDLNRNFPCPLEGPHPDGNDWQPETIAMMDFAEGHHITMGANYHGGTEVVNYPWDFQSELHPDDDWYVYTSQVYANAAQANSPAGYMNGYNNGITNGFAWYETHGGRQDYMNYFHYAREVTMEISDTKLLPEIFLEDHWNYNRESMLLYLEEALYGIHGFVTNDAGNPVEAKIEVLNHDFDNSHVYSDSDLGDYYRLLYEGIYDLKASSYGYLPEVAENVSVTNGNLVDLDFTLQTAPLFTVSGNVEDGVDHNPVVNAMIEFIETPLDPVFTDNLGNYTIENVPEGSYQVYVSSDPYSNLLTQIDIAENNTIHDFSICLSDIEDFESASFLMHDWAFAGNADWMITNEVAFEGSFSARSGNIIDNQESSILLNLEVTAPGEVSFYLKVSSEVVFDYFRFYIDGVLQDRWSGEVDWQEAHYPVDEGIHEFKWTYEKDENTSNGNDCAWLDMIALPCTEEMSTPELPEPAKVSLLGNYPNPFNPETAISFTINSQEEIPTRLEIYNIKGQKVNTLIDANLSAGNYNIIWDGTDSNSKKVGSGMYFYRLISSDLDKTEKMLLLK